MSDEPSTSGAEEGSQDEQAQSPEKVQEPTSSKPEGDSSRETEKESDTGIKLPGVADTGPNLFPELPRKGRDGKFVSREQAEKDAEDEMREERDAFFGGAKEPETEEKKEVPEPPPGATKAPDSAEKFAFAGKDYESKEAAEQSVRSMQGMHKPLVDRAEGAEGREKVAVDSAHDWRRYAMSLEEQVKGVPGAVERSSQTPAPAKVEANALDVSKILDRINGEQFEKIAQDPDRGLPVAARFLAAQVLDSVHHDLIPQIRTQIMEELNKGLEPSREREAFESATREVTNMFEAGQGLKFSDGNLVFPELQDAEKTMEIGRIWKAMDLPKGREITPRALQQAIALYRMKHGQPTITTPEETTPEPAVKPAVIASQSNVGSSASVGQPRQTEEGVFAQGLDSADLVDKNLGFAVRRRR